MRLLRGLQKKGQNKKPKFRENITQSQSKGKENIEKKLQMRRMIQTHQFLTTIKK